MRVTSSVRPLVLSIAVALVVSCTGPSAPQSTATPAVAASAVPTDTAAPTPTPKPLPAKGRSVSIVGNAIVATGNFRGTHDTQIAVLEDPASDLSLRIGVRVSFSAADAPATWLQSDKNFLSLSRAKLAVADVDFDGKDDLVALYNSGENTS